MNRSYLIQRLTRPFKGSGTLNAMIGAFSFGGGLVNGGLSKDAMDMLGMIFRFDYMGSSEFEWGAVPDALSALAQLSAKGNLTAFSFTVPVEEVGVPFTFSEEKKDKPLPTRNEIHVVCRKGDEKAIEARIRQMAAADYVDSVKEQPRFNLGIVPRTEYHTDLIGWLELDNGWFAFCEREPFEKVCDLFEVSVGKVPTS